jgi:MFS family permease
MTVARSRTRARAADLTLLRDRRFARLTGGRAVSTLGTAFGPIALAFGVLALPNAGPDTLSVVLAGHSVPQLALVLFGGVIGDRMPRHRVLVAGHLLAGTAWTAMAVMVLTGWAPVPVLTGSAFLAGVASALLLPALTSVVPDVVPRESLQSANALLRLITNTANLAGLAVAGVAVAALGPGTALAVNAATNLTAAGLLAGLGAVGPVRRLAARRILPDLRDGLVEFVKRQWVWVTVLCAAFINAGTAAAFGVLGPVLADQQLGGAVPWSMVMVGYTAGMLASVVVALRWRPHHPLRSALLLTPLLAAPLLALGVGVPLALVIVAAVASGAALSLFSVLWETTLQRHVPTDTLARVTSCNYLVALSLKPIGIVLVGHTAAEFGAGPAMLMLGGLLLVAGLAALTSPQVRQLTEETETFDERTVR